MVSGLSMVTFNFLPGVPVALTPLSFPSVWVVLLDESELDDESDEVVEEPDSPYALSERLRATLTTLAPRMERILRCFTIFIQPRVVGVPEELPRTSERGKK